MNRRSFFRTLAGAAAGFTILPPATTYDRIWKATRQPSLKRSLWEARCYTGEWRWVNITDNDRAMQVLEQRFVQHVFDDRMPIYRMPVGPAPFPYGAGEVLIGTSDVPEAAP